MSVSNRPRTTSKMSLVRRAAVAAAGISLVLVSTSTAASAKGTGVDPVVTPPKVCNPVTALSYKGDTSTADSNTATITVTYAVKACDKNPIRVDTRLFLTAAPSPVAYENTDSALSGKFTATGVRANTSYQAKVTVYDAASGTVVGSQTIFAAAIYKGV